MAFRSMVLSSGGRVARVGARVVFSFGISEGEGEEGRLTECLRSGRLWLRRSRCGRAGERLRGLGGCSLGVRCYICGILRHYHAVVSVSFLVLGSVEVVFSAFIQEYDASDWSPALELSSEVKSSHPPRANCETRRKLLVQKEFLSHTDKSPI